MAEYYHSLTNLAKDKQQAVYHTHQKPSPSLPQGIFMLLVLLSHPPMMACVIFRLEHLVRSVARFLMMPLIMWHLVIFTLPKSWSKNHIRYSGSPIAMGFGEIGRHKQVLIVDLPLNKKCTDIKVAKE